MLRSATLSIRSIHPPSNSIKPEDSTDERSAKVRAKIDRVLWIDPSGFEVVTIDIFLPNALPVAQTCNDIETALLAHDAQILEVDPYASLLRPEDLIPEKHRSRRDATWEVIAPLVEDPERKIFDSQGRGKLLNEYEKKVGRIALRIYVRTVFESASYTLARA